MNIFENLDKLLNFLIVKYEAVNNSWKSSELYSEETNLKKYLVADIENHDEIINLIWNHIININRIIQPGRKNIIINRKEDVPCLNILY